MNVTISSPFSLACTDFQFRLDNEEKTPICGRNMDFPEAMNSRISIHRQKEQWVSRGPDKETGFSWEVQYGFIGFSAFSTSMFPYLIDDVVDGLNERGLSGAVLTLNATKYQTVPPDQHHYALTQMDVLPYILSACSTVKDVKEALQGKYVWAAPFPGLATPPLLHYSFHDKEGNSLVLEYIDGYPVFTDNRIGVLTNDPTLPQQIENLQNYAYLSAEQLPETIINGYVIPSKGSGSGTIGLPGSTDPQSRFVTSAKLLELTQKYAPLKSYEEGIMRAQSILGRVHVIDGEQIRTVGNLKYFESTLWSVIKVLGEQLMLCYFSKSDPSMRRIDLKEIDFSESDKPIIKVPISTGKICFINESEKFKN